MPPSKKKNFYAVAVGHTTGIFTSWDLCKKSVLGFKGARYKGFPDLVSATEFVGSKGKSPVAKKSPAPVIRRLGFGGPGPRDPGSKVPSSSSRKKTASSASSRVTTAALAGAPSSRKSGFGSAGTRSTAQAAAAAVHAQALLTSFPDHAVVIFTDGACVGNPGPCGAGAAVYIPASVTGLESHPGVDRWKGTPTLEASLALGLQGTNNIGELAAVGLALSLLDVASGKGWDLSGLPIQILTDSKYTRGTLQENWKAKANVSLVGSIKRKIAEMAKASGSTITIQWVAGHVGIAGNERADCLANSGAEVSAAQGDTFLWDKFDTPCFGTGSAADALRETLSRPKSSSMSVIPVLKKSTIRKAESQSTGDVSPPRKRAKKMER